MTVLDLTTALVIGGLFAGGFFLLLQRTLMRLLFGFLVLGHATNLLLLAAAGPPGAPPITGELRAGEEPSADPLPQAMALTAIVITFALTILLLALVHRSWQLHGHDEVRDDAEDRRLEDNQQREHDAAMAEQAEWEARDGFGMRTEPPERLGHRPLRGERGYRPDRGGPSGATGSSGGAGGSGPPGDAGGTGGSGGSGGSGGAGPDGERPDEGEESGR